MSKGADLYGLTADVIGKIQCPRSHAPAWECIAFLVHRIKLQRLFLGHNVFTPLALTQAPVTVVCVPTRERGNEKVGNE